MKNILTKKSIYFIIQIIYILLSGCNKNESSPLWENEELYLGSFSLYTTNSVINTNFNLPERLDVARLVFVIIDSNKQATSMSNSLTDSFQKQIIKISIYSNSISIPFYEQKINAKKHTIPCNWFYPESSLILTGINPFNYPVTDNYSIPENKGLYPRQSYRIKLQVLGESYLTNNVQAWLCNRIYVKDTFGVSKMGRSGAEYQSNRGQGLSGAPGNLPKVSR